VNEHNGILMYENLIKQIYNANLLCFLFIKNYDSVLLYIMHTCYAMYFSFTSSEHFIAIFEKIITANFLCSKDVAFMLHASKSKRTRKETVETAWPERKHCLMFREIIFLRSAPVFVQKRLSA
jgi:hypothetical protein